MGGERRRKLFLPKQSLEMDEFLADKENVKLVTIGNNVIEASWGKEVDDPTKPKKHKTKGVTTLEDWDDTLPMVKETITEWNKF